MLLSWRLLRRNQHRDAIASNSGRINSFETKYCLSFLMDARWWWDRSVPIKLNENYDSMFLRYFLPHWNRIKLLKFVSFCKFCSFNLKQGGRLPPAYFVPSQFCKERFEKEKVFFLEKHSFFIRLSNFPNVGNFLIFFAKKNLISRAQNIFRKSYVLLRILLQICHL